jgi:hypothetical protein
MLGQLVEALRLREGSGADLHLRVPLRPVLEDLAAEFAGAARLKGITFRVTSSLSAALSHPVLLTGMLRNLIRNAIDYTPPGGSVFVTCHRHSSIQHAGANPIKSDFIARRTLRHVQIVRYLNLATVVHRGERAMAKTVADQFAEVLAIAGVKRIYGIVGDSLNGLTDAIRRQGKIEWLHVRHEEVAAFAAGAEAHLTGELAVCAGSCGPGNLHLINGLFDCHRSRVPVLAIAAQIPSAEIGAGYFQETHPQDLFRECSPYCELAAGANQMPRVLEVAIREAVGKACCRQLRW